MRTGVSNESSVADESESGQVSVRPLAVEDAEAMLHVLADESLHHFTGGEPPTLETLISRYSAQVSGGPPDGSEEWTNLLVLVDSEPVGYVQATVPKGEDVAEIAWVIGRLWQGRGYAKQAADLLARYLVARGVGRVSALIHPQHHASARIATHLGMAPSSEVVDGEVRWMGALK